MGYVYSVYCSYITGEDENNDDDDDETTTASLSFARSTAADVSGSTAVDGGMGIPGVEHADRITHRWVFNCDGDNAGRSKELLFSLVAASAA